MLNEPLKELITSRLLPRVQTPAQYVGGELNAATKDHTRVRGKLCLAFPDTYAIGMSHCGLQVLYDVVNRLDDWVCERVFAPWGDMEALLRQHDLPLYSLESFTPLRQFDVLGFTLQYDLCSTNVLTILDLGGIPLLAQDRTLEDPLVVAGGPCAHNPEPMAPFVDVFVIGDGEESLPGVCREWLRLKQSGGDRKRALAELAAELPYAYVPRFYRSRSRDDPAAALEPTGGKVPRLVQPAMVADLDATPLPSRPIVPYIGCVQDRIAIEIMRGCPGRCRFCQSTTIKRPLRTRSVDTIVRAAVESYRNTGHNEISLLSLSTSDYPHFDRLLSELQEEFRPLGVNISVPSLRVNEQLRSMGELLGTDRRASLTLAPEVARDDMRRQIGKEVKNEDLIEGCRRAFEHGFRRVKLYFMCGLPGEREADLDGIIEMAETIARLGRESGGRHVTVVANVSNFVPRPQTPYQFNGMQTREYFHWAHQRLRRRRRLRSVELKCHDVERSLLEGVLCRGGRRIATIIESAWRRGARFDAWGEQFHPQLWWEAMADGGVCLEETAYRRWTLEARLPWDHIGIRQGRAYLEREQNRSLVQLREMESGQ